MNRHHGTRLGSSNRKLLSLLTKASRPTTTKRTTSYQASNTSTITANNAAVTVQPASSPTSSSSTAEADAGYGGVEDMTSFLQFCATCEKQIVTPTNTVLYCSEACRRRDSVKTVPVNVQYSPPLSPSMPRYEYTQASIIPRRSPTILRPLSTTFSQLSLYELDTDRKTSTDSLDESTFGMPTQSRPYMQRTSTSGESSSNIPSLVHSPASSYETMISIDQRPLPRKHSCTTHRGGVDLVTPILSTSVKLSQSVAVAEPRRKSVPTESRRQRTGRS